VNPPQSTKVATEIEGVRKPLTRNDIPRIRAQLKAEIKDLTGEQPLELPPFREVNHRIPLIDYLHKITKRLPKCPDKYRTQLIDKLNRYAASGIWLSQPVEQASTLMCVPKNPKNTDLLRTVVDLREKNDNTVKDLTPFPDQDMIRSDVAKAPYRSKIDLRDFYEQIRVEPDDVSHNAFSCPYGTYISEVMLQGDCNAPSTAQRLMTRIFIKQIGKFLHVYIDDVFVFSYSIEEHLEHLRIVFGILRRAKLYLSTKDAKVDLFSERLECLGHLITNEGIHADSDKMASIRNWPTSLDYHAVQHFLGLVNYVGPYMPNVAAFASPLSEISNKCSWIWICCMTRRLIPSRL
jgi:hypothetical protein